MLRTDLTSDPYPVFKRLRRESPVCRLEPGGPWLLARHADILTVLKDPGRFRSSRTTSGPAATGPELLLKTRGLVGTDPPEHTRIRAALRDSFAPARMRLLESQIRQLARAQIRDVVSRGDVELVSVFTKPFPMEVITLLIGVDREKASEFGRWADILVTSGSPDCSASEEEIMSCAVAMHDYFSSQIAERSGKSGDDLISTLVRSLDDSGKALVAQELVTFLRLLLVAGSETTTHLIGNTILALHEHSGLWSAVQSDRRLIPDLIEESLRYDSPVPSLIRWATDETALGGVTIGKNEAVMPLLASGNHDEAVFSEPERFELDRPVRPHLSFGAGPHFCMGVVLARLQVRIIFEELFAAASRLELDDSKPIDRVESFYVRGPTSLPLRVFAT